MIGVDERKLKLCQKTRKLSLIPRIETSNIFLIVIDTSIEASHVSHVQPVPICKKNFLINRYEIIKAKSKKKDLLETL